MHALAVKRVEFATKGKTRNVEQSEELREAQMRAMAEAKESEKAEQQETERQREKQAEEEKKIKQIRFEKAKEIKARREKDAENMIQIDADLALKSLDLALLEPMGSGKLSELMVRHPRRKGTRGCRGRVLAPCSRKPTSARGRRRWSARRTR